ncbi:hypothetical protein Tco_0886085 [Tanacetum coccineum]
MCHVYHSLNVDSKTDSPRVHEDVGVGLTSECGLWEWQSSLDTESEVLDEFWREEVMRVLNAVFTLRKVKVSGLRYGSLRHQDCVSSGGGPGVPIVLSLVGQSAPVVCLEQQGANGGEDCHAIWSFIEARGGIRGMGRQGYCSGGAVREMRGRVTRFRAWSKDCREQLVSCSFDSCGYRYVLLLAYTVTSMLFLRETKMEPRALNQVGFAWGKFLSKMFGGLNRWDVSKEQVNCELLLGEDNIYPLVVSIKA